MDPVRSDPTPGLISPLPGLIRSYPAPIPDLTQSLLNGSDPAPDLIHCLPACTRSFSAPPRPGSAPSPSAPAPKGNGSATATGRASQNAFLSVAGRLWHRPWPGLLTAPEASQANKNKEKQGKTRILVFPCFSLFFLVSELVFPCFSLFSLFFLVFPCFCPCFSLFLSPP
jgi:hypothetical protein